MEKQLVVTNTQKEFEMFCRDYGEDHNFKRIWRFEDVYKYKPGYGLSEIVLIYTYPGSYNNLIKVLIWRGFKIKRQNSRGYWIPLPKNQTT